MATSLTTLRIGVKERERGRSIAGVASIG